MSDGRAVLAYDTNESRGVGLTDSSEHTREVKETIRREVREKMMTVALPDSRFVFQLEHFNADFPGSEQLVARLAELPCYDAEGVVWVTPDNCMEYIKAQLIREQRRLLANIHIALGFHYVTPGSVPPGQERFASTLDGGLVFGKPLGLDDVRALAPVSFVVTGCTVINPDGVRYGKGHGYFDVEWGILSELGVVSDATTLIVCAHDFAVVNQPLPTEPTDVVADWVLTPTRTIEVADRPPRPTGIDWDRLSDHLAGELRVPLDELRALTEHEEGL